MSRIGICLIVIVTLVFTAGAAGGATRRLQYANDRVVLPAVDGPQNESKGDDDASEWLPPRTPTTVATSPNRSRSRRSTRSG